MAIFNSASGSMLLCALSCLLPQARAVASSESEQSVGPPVEGAKWPGAVGQQELPLTLPPQGLVFSLGEKQFDAVNAADIEDLVRYSPNLSTFKRFGGDENGVIALRGANGSQSARMLVMVDGFVVSNFLGNSERFSPKTDIIGPSDVGQIDIAYGPYSARYGGNSMGGVVSVNTRVPTEGGAYAKLQSFAMPFTQYGVDETFVGYGVEAGGTWKRPSSPWTVQVSGRHLENTGQPLTYFALTPSFGPAVPVVGAYSDPNVATPVFGAVSPAEIVQDQFRMRTRYDFRNGWNIEGVIFGWFTDQDLTDPRTFLSDLAGQPVYEGRVNPDGNVYLANGLTLGVAERAEFLAGVRTSGKIGDWEARASLSRYWIDTDDIRTSFNYSLGIADQSGTETLQENPGWWTLDAGFSRAYERNHVAVGFNFNQYETRENLYETENWRTASNPFFRSSSFGSTRSAGVYAEDEFTLTPRSSLTVGVRGDWWQAYDGGVAENTGILLSAEYPDREDQSISPKLSYQVRLGDSWAIQLSAGAATRFPTIGELFQGQLNEATGSIDPGTFDPNLEPERSRDANLVIRWENRNVRLTSSAFYQEIDDSIYSYPALNQFGILFTNYKNIDFVRQFGVELIAEAGDVVVEGLDFELSVGWTDAHTLDNSRNTAAEGQEFPGIPEWRANGSVTYRATPQFSTSLGWRFASRPNSDLFGSIGDTYGFQSGYTLLDARFAWTPRDSLEINLGVDNLTNEEAYSVQPLARRTAFAEVRVNF